MLPKSYPATLADTSNQYQLADPAANALEICVFVKKVRFCLEWQNIHTIGLLIEIVRPSANIVATA